MVTGTCIGVFLKLSKEKNNDNLNINFVLTMPRKRFLVCLQFENNRLNFPENTINFADLFKKIKLSFTNLLQKFAGSRHILTV